MLESWLRSMHESKPVDKQGNPIPWWTYSSIYFLDERIENNFTVFEFGCGHSTFWLSQRVSKVISVEHDIRWFNKMKDLIPENVKIVYRECEKGYESEVIEQGLFDIVVIDGINRVKCAKYAVEALKPDGVLIWDDSHRDNYKKFIKELKYKNFKEISFSGLKPGNFYADKTSVLYRENNCLGI